MPTPTSVLTRPNQQSGSRLPTQRWVNNDGGAWTNGSGFHGTGVFPISPPVLGGNQLAYFTVTGFFYDVEQQNSNGTSILPQLLDVSAFVDFIPRVPAGFACMAANLNHNDGTIGDTLVPIAPITGRLLGGSLRSIAIGDPVGVGLLCNSPFLNMAVQLEQYNWPVTYLIYDVRFRDVTYGGASQLLTNFGFIAPNAPETISITTFNPTFEKVPYGGP